ncbi:MAG TPA: hypothetical protein VGB91_05860 [Rhizomicrobium sp.]
MTGGGLFRTALFAFGIAAVLLGLWWVLQGTGVVPLGFMANHMQWTWRGAVLAAMGAALAFFARRR